MDARSQELAARVARDMPAWAAELGPPPPSTDVAAVVGWRLRAGIVAGYRDAFGLDSKPKNTSSEEELSSIIGPPPPQARPNVRQWWQRAAVALGRVEPATLADLPDEHLEAIVDQARQCDAAAPPAVASHLRAASAQLRAARTGEGQNVLAGRPVERAAVAEIEALTAGVAQLELSQRQREHWRASTSRLHAQAEAGAAELAAQAEARANWSHRDMDQDTLQAEVIRVEQQLRTATWVAERHATVRDQGREMVISLSAELARLTQKRPDVSIATTTVANERAVAAKLDELGETLARRRLGRSALRPAVRNNLHEELGVLLVSNPGLRCEPLLREQRWTTIMDLAHAAERRRLAETQGHLDEAVVIVDQQADIARGARVHVEQLSERCNSLQAELGRRTGGPPSTGETPRKRVYVGEGQTDRVRAAPEEAVQLAGEDISGGSARWDAVSLSEQRMLPGIETTSVIDGFPAHL